MPDATSQGNNQGGEAGNSNADAGNKGGSNDNQSNNDNSGNSNADNFDPKNLSVEALGKLFESDVLYTHPRFKELSAKAKELNELKEQQAQADEKSMKEQNKWKELAEKKEQEAKELADKVTNLSINQALQAKLMAEGVIDADAAVQLIDKSTVKIDDNGKVTGVDEAIKSLKESKAYLFDAEKAKNIGQASNGGNGEGGGTGAPKKFKRSQLRDPAFYKANEKDILAALRAGQIEDDIS